jgi:hypothetical protein
MTWAFESKDYYMAYILYTEYNTGIPNSLLYKLPSKHFFRSIDDFMETNNNKTSQDEYLNKIFKSFKLSKYTRLPEWDDSFGYKYTI